MGDMKTLISIKLDVLSEVVGIGLSPVSGCTVMAWSPAKITGGNLLLGIQRIGENYSIQLQRHGGSYPAVASFPLVFMKPGALHASA